MHRKPDRETETLPWEPFINFYNFNGLPIINIDSLSFLLNTENEIKLYEAITTFNINVIILSKALNDVQKYHCVYIEKLNLWEIKIKTMKGLRAMQINDLKSLRERTDHNIINHLTFLSNLIIETSDLLTDYATQLSNTW